MLPASCFSLRQWIKYCSVWRGSRLATGISLAEEAVHKTENIAASGIPPAPEPKAAGSGVGSGPADAAAIANSAANPVCDLITAQAALDEAQEAHEVNHANLAKAQALSEDLRRACAWSAQKTQAQESVDQLRLKAFFSKQAVLKAKALVMGHHLAAKQRAAAKVPAAPADMADSMADAAPGPDPAPSPTLDPPGMVTNAAPDTAPDAATELAAKLGASQAAH
jgi:hypothetical protein